MKKILVAASMMLFGMMSVQAANNYTLAGTDINNTATLSFTAGGAAQPDVNSTTDTFVVDNKVDVVVTVKDLVPVPVASSSTDKYLSFTVRNDGNKIQDYNLTALADDDNPFGLATPDNFDATNIRIFVDKNNDGVYDAGDTETFIDELAPDANKTVFIVANMPAGLTDGWHADYTLIAETRTGGNTGNQGTTLADNTGDADLAATEQNIFADAKGAGTSNGDGAAHNAKHSDNSAFRVEMPDLSATKGSCVYSDPVNGTVTPKRIPGAIVMYTFDIVNAGSAKVTDLNLTDTLQADLDGATLSSGTADTLGSVTVNIDQSSCNACSDGSRTTGGVDQADADGSAQGINITNISVDKAGSNQDHTCISFSVEIK